MDLNQSTQCSRQLYPLLQQQLDQVGQYLSYLEQIKLSIAHNDNNQLNQLLTQSTPLIAAIEHTQITQQQLLQASGFDSTTQGLEACISACQQDQLSALNQQLKQQVKELQKSLMINELLIKKNQHRIRQSIRILSGHTSDPVAGSVYSSNGNTHDATMESHTLARV